MRHGLSDGIMSSESCDFGFGVRLLLVGRATREYSGLLLRFRRRWKRLGPLCVFLSGEVFSMKKV